MATEGGHGALAPYTTGADPGQRTPRQLAPGTLAGAVWAPA